MLIRGQLYPTYNGEDIARRNNYTASTEISTMSNGESRVLIDEEDLELYKGTGYLLVLDIRALITGSDDSEYWGEWQIDINGSRYFNGTWSQYTTSGLAGQYSDSGCCTLPLFINAGDSVKVTLYMGNNNGCLSGVATAYLYEAAV